MKRYIITILIIAGAAFTVSAQGQQEKTATTDRCEQYKNGHFIVKESLIGKKYIIKRKGNRQIETDPDGTQFVFDVNWIDNCTYTLELRKIARNPNNIEWEEGQVITVKILDTHKDGYIQESTSNFDDLTFVKEMVKVDPRSLKVNLDEIEFEEDVSVAR